MSLRSAHRTVILRECLKLADSNEHIEPRVSRTITVNVLDVMQWPIEVKGFGLNEARFDSLEQVYEFFGGGSLARIRLDYDGNKLVIECIEELGFVRPTGYFT